MLFRSVYQQQDVESTAIFAPEAVRGSVNSLRQVGPITFTIPGHPELKDKFTVCSMDPAMSGDTFSVVLTGDASSGKRYLADASRMPAPTPEQIRNLIKLWTEKYQPKLWVIEKNAFQLFLTQDTEIRNYLGSRGIRLVEHYTGKNKMDAEFGVASMAQIGRAHV